MEQLKQNFASGLTRPRHFRLAQLSALRELLRQNKQSLIDALIADFKCPSEAELEVLSCISACSSAIANLGSWMHTERKSCPFPFKLLDSAFVQWEPKGLVLIVGGRLVVCRLEGMIFRVVQEAAHWKVVGGMEGGGKWEVRWKLGMCSEAGQSTECREILDWQDSALYSFSSRSLFSTRSLFILYSLPSLLIALALS